MQIHWRREWTVSVFLLSAACGVEGDHPGVAMAPQSESAALCPAGPTLQGVDVSSYQGSINWGQVKGAGIAWGYAKATEGTGYQDPTFPGNWSGMANAGVVRGAYHFFHPDLNGTQQADYFLAYVGSLGAGDLPPMLDWEVTDGASGSTAGTNAQAFIDEIQAKTGRQTVIYTSPGLWSGFGVPTSFGQNPLWVADWTYSTSSCPSLPSGWSSFVFWQWSDGQYGTGSVPGIPKAVDRDVFNGDASALSQLAGGGSPSCQYPLGHPLGSGGAVGAGCQPGATPTLPAAPSACGSIPVGEALGPGQSVSSCDGRFALVMQTDGNVVEYAHGEALWATGTSGKNGYMFAMQSDGNLVLYDAGSCPLWASNTGGNPGATFAVQSDGNLVVYSSSGKALWSSGTGPIAPVPAACGQFPANTGLGPGDSLSSCQACFDLVMQTDGNLVLYRQGGQALWATGTSGQKGLTFVMQTDGNAVLYSNAGCPLWDSATSGNAGAFLALQDDGNLVVYGASGKALWASNTVVCPGGCSCLPPPPPSTTSSGTSSSGGTGTSTGSSSTTGGSSTGGASSGGIGSTGSGSTGAGSSSAGESGGKTTGGGTASSGTGSGGAGSTGAGSLGNDQGTQPAPDGGQPNALAKSSGCGCTTGGSPPDLSLLGLVAFAFVCRRRVRLS